MGFSRCKRNYNSLNRWLLYRVGIVALPIAILACGAKVKPTNNRSMVIDLRSGFVGQRQYYQSRSMISLNVNDEQIEDGDTFSLSNASNGAVLIPSQRMNIGHGLRLTNGYSLAGEGYSVSVQIFPQSADMIGKLEYGRNLLHLEVSSAKGLRAWEKEVVLEDFPIFGLSRATFSKNSQVEEGFQGWFPGVVRPVVAAENGNTLRTDAFHILND